MQPVSDSEHFVNSCLFCQIIHGQADAQFVFEDEHTLAFLDKRPLFPGHTLLVPRWHVHTILDLPDVLVEPLFKNARLLCQAVETALQAEGTFVAFNNKVSQSVPHLHLHIIPRRKSDGLKGFFWPRIHYKDDQELQQVQAAIRSEISRIQAEK